MMYVYVYIYIYIEREISVWIYIYIYMYIPTCKKSALHPGCDASASGRRASQGSETTGDDVKQTSKYKQNKQTQNNKGTTQPNNKYKH